MDRAAKKVWLPERLAYDASSEDEVLLERWEAEEGQTWMPSSWWVVLLTPLGVWVWWISIVLVFNIVSWLFGL